MAEDVSTRDKVVELLNYAAFLPSSKEKVTTLAQVQELVIYRDPALLDSFFEEIVAFQTDRNSDVRKFVVSFIEEACKKDSAVLPRLVPNIQILINDEAIVVTKRVVQAATQIYKVTLTMLAVARIITEEMEQTWYIISSVKTTIINMIDHDNDGIRTLAIKFMESLVLMQTYPEPDSVLRQGEFNLEQVPLTLKIARPRKLEEEARQVVSKIIHFQGSLHISSVNLMTCMSSLTIIARARPQFLGKVILALEILHANLPPTLTKSQVNSVRKHLKLQLSNLLRHTAAYDYQENISTILTDLGVSNAEITKVLPSKEEIKQRVKRDRTFDDGSEHVNKKVCKEPMEQHSSAQQDSSEKKTALDITQEWLFNKLNVETVTHLVMVTMLNLPDSMPALFGAAYTPVTSAGSKSQILHISRLLASQLTAVGLGPGIAHAEKDEFSPSHDSDDDTETGKGISRLVGSVVYTTTTQKMPVLLPAGVTGVTSRQKQKSIQLSDVTKPLKKSVSHHLQLLLLRQILQCDRNTGHVDQDNQQKLIVGLLSCCTSEAEKLALEKYVVNDLSKRISLIFSWLFTQHALRHEFSFVSKILNLDQPECGSVQDNTLERILRMIIDQAPSKDRDENLCRILVESPSLNDAALDAVLEVGSQGPETVEKIANALKDIVFWRPGLAEAASKRLLLLATHDSSEIRDAVAPSLLLLCESNEYKPFIVDTTKVHLNELTKAEPPRYLIAHYFGRPPYLPEWTESSVKACLHLFILLLPVQQTLIHDLATVYVKTVNEAKRVILRLLEGPVSGMGMESPQLLYLVENCPKGSETLITRIIHILTEKAPPSEALVNRVRELYNKRVSDVRFLIPVLTGLSKKEVVAVLPKLIKLNPHVVKEVFNRLWGVTLDSGTSPLTPSELLVALHLIDTDKCDVKTIIKATSLCFAERNIYTAEELAQVLQQLLELQSLPTLFMRTVIQAVANYPKLLSFVMNILQRLITREVWTMPKIWQGFIKCCQRSMPQSFQILLQLPPAQLEDAFKIAPEIKAHLAKHISSLTEVQQEHIDKKLLEVVNSPSDFVNMDFSIPPPNYIVQNTAHSIAVDDS